VRSGLLTLLYWSLAATAVAFVAGLWFFLPCTSAKHIPDLITGGHSMQPTDQAVAPSPTLIMLRKMLPELVKRAHPDDRAAITSFYEERRGPLMWVTETGLSDKGRAVISEVRMADDWGLHSSDFSVPQLPARNLSPEVAAETEIKLTLTILRYARYARGGRIGDPSRISELLDHTPPVRPPKLVLTDLAATDAPDTYLRSLHPKHEQFEKLRQLLLKLRRANGSKEEGKLPADNKLKWIVYGENLQEGMAHDLNGQPKPASASAEIERILINMERWRWLPEALGKLYVWDNVPEALTRVVKDNKIIHSDRIIVGQPTWPTPSFSADMKMVVFRPTWSVPDGIKVKELSPILRKSSSGGLFGLFGGGYSAESVLEAYQLRANINGHPVDANSIDWNNVDIRSVSFQQPPGPKNPLGDVKFMFPNKHDVYMHDTPERDLFARSFRALSHGCMRVEHPRRLAAVLLAEDKGWSEAKVESLFDGGSQEVQLSTHIPVHVTYFTAMVDYEGKLRTFGDLYGLDNRVGAALFGRKVRFETPRYDDEPIASRQQDMRGQVRQRQSSGPSTLVEAISDIFSP
jgi:murein L,D-transpeptidase YcbB/YkuD